ncbi:hypothetical protein ACF08N_01810 [Streptomyces sp. NPDC015127]|uniref:hypothetical protein n=1 Tax=Streptomyces sp. NPDC015127 TaxID=3364939 RepID=UPI0036FCCA21
MKRIAIGVCALALVGGAVAVTVGAAEEDTSVTVHTEPVKTRADYIALWEEALARSGKELPAGVESMSTQEIFDAWALEAAKYGEHV